MASASTPGPGSYVRKASIEDSSIVAGLLHDFNREFGSPTPGPAVLAERLRTLLRSGSTFALLAGEPPVGVALVTRRSNVWYPKPVLLLDELYVAPTVRDQGIGSALIARLLAESLAEGAALIEINVDESDVDAQRFYRRHGFTDRDPDSGDRATYFSREL